MRSIKEVRRERDDLSTFLVHLTRDIIEGQSAYENLINILNSQVIEARNPKGLCYNWDPEFSSFAKSVCFTETPLTYIKYLFDIQKNKLSAALATESEAKDSDNNIFYLSNLLFSILNLI
mgnify:CR=1 FL=1